ncbi:MAG: hypothetical protein K9K81_11025 [Desulfobacteraceae bacterium]|nr:hypothetical protein [Desulfobacteraceae bacterium]
MFFRRKKVSKRKRAADAFSKGIGMEAHKAAWSIIRSPVDMARQRRETGEDPSDLKRLSFNELLEHWEIPREKIPRLKRTLIAEMAAYCVLACVGVSALIYGIANPDYGIAGTLLGVLFGLVASMQFLLRHHWYSILANEKYFTFRDYIMRKERR